MIDFSRISYKSLVGKLLRLPLKAVPRTAILPILQGLLRGKKWIAGSGTHGYWLGTYELDKRRVFESVVSRGSVVFDVGAHTGFYTLLSSLLVNEKGRVFAFEPNQKNLLYLKKHLELNKVNNVTIIEAAVSDVDGEVSFTEGRNNVFTGHISDTGAAKVSSVSLDELFVKGVVPLPDYVKIDIEGAEMRALLGARKILEAGHPTIFLSTHGTKLHKESCDFLRSIGYRLEPLDKESLNQSEEILACWSDCDVEV